jgi:hypothetical protein
MDSGQYPMGSLRVEELFGDLFWTAGTSHTFHLGVALTYANSQTMDDQFEILYMKHETLLNWR